MKTELTQQNGLLPKRTLTQVAFEMNDEDATALVFTFDNGWSLVLSDDGQNCCEHRFMSSDDDLESLVGSQLVSISLREVTETLDGKWESCHEQAFVVIQTTKASMTLVTHNEHNGYYGGFGLQMKIRTPEGDVMARHCIETRDWN